MSAEDDVRKAFYDGWHAGRKHARKEIARKTTTFTHDEELVAAIEHAQDVLGSAFHQLVTGIESGNRVTGTDDLEQRIGGKK